MNTTMTSTGEKIRFANGKIFCIYKKMTKVGMRFYYWSGGRFFPISRNEVDQIIVLI